MSASPPLRIGDLVEIPPVRTVVRLDESRRQPAMIAGSFVFTSEVAAHFDVLSEALAQTTGRGYFLQGDFGSGKSHFLAALSAWLEGSLAADCLTANHAGLKRLQASNRRFLPVAVSLVNFRAATPLERILVTAVEEALTVRGQTVALTPLANFWRQFREMLREPALAEAFARENPSAGADPDAWFRANPREAYGAGLRFLKAQGLKTPEALVEERHETFARAMAAVRGAGFAGLVLLLDELSEFLRAKADSAQLNEDARTLQFFGEAAGGEPLWIVAAVQESVERTGDIAQPTLRKIKDRFPVRFALSTVHIRDLLSRRLVRTKPGAEEQIHRIYETCRQHFPTFAWDYDHFRGVYPVHPLTLQLLEGLTDLFSQHRGIVDFVHSRLAGDPGRNIPGILDRPAAELLAPDSIYEHFAARLAEFSAFHIYPRHIVPHLDEVIGRVLQEENDRATARRLVRILVLHAIHPTAKPPSIRVLAELASCQLAAQDPDLNAQYVAEVLLDPVARESRFLVRKPSPVPGDPLQAIFAVVTQEDHGKTLRARLTRAAADLGKADPRPLKDTLAELPESVSWPGPDIQREPVPRQINWRQSFRTALVALVEPGSEARLRDRLQAELTTGRADFALALTLGDQRFESEHTTVWAIPCPGQEAEVLREYHAAKTVAAELRPSSPAEAPLVAPARELLKRLEPGARQAALNTVYAGEFRTENLQFEAAARQLKRFDRLLETAGEHLLENRYPNFKEIAPRLLQPSPRLYQRLIEEFILPGSLSLRDARAKGLAESIEALAVPLGLVAVRSGAYVVAPDPAEHPFLLHFFNLLDASRATPLNEVLLRLQTGPYGVPRDTAAFLLAALGHGGLISLLSHGRALPLEFLRFASIDTADAVAPGELINKADRDTLMAECPFLAPSQGWGTFGLRQQRDAWQAVIKFGDNSRALVQEISRGLRAAVEYSAFETFDLVALQAHLEAVTRVTEEIKISRPAREGLERFLQAWRGSGLKADDLARLQQMRRFFTRFAEQFIFISHYLRHRCVEEASRADEKLGAVRHDLLDGLRQPEVLVLQDDGAQLADRFAAFRELYMEFYRQRHATHHRPSTKAELPKLARRALDALRRLAGVESLDRPPGLERLLREMDAPERTPCVRNLVEELLRSPVCGCGFQIGDAPPKVEKADPAAQIETSLNAYAGILQSAQVLEPLTARAYALRDMDAKAAERLRGLCQLLQRPDVKPSALLDLLDEQSVAELNRALLGKARIEERRLTELAARLAGRRLTAAKIQQVVTEWLGNPPSETILAIAGEAGGDASSVATPPTGWWPSVHEGLADPAPQPGGEAESQALAEALEKRFPSARLRPRLARLDDRELTRFVLREPGHTRAIQTAWTLLAERGLTGTTLPLPEPPVAAHLCAGEAAGIRNRLEMLGRLQRLLKHSPPRRLTARLAAVEIWHDPWATRELQEAVEAVIGKLAAESCDWLASIPPVKPLALADHPVVMVLDAIPPDAWLAVTEELAPPLSDGQTTWHRLETSARTVPSLNALFGFDAKREPVEEFAAHGVAYHHLEGTERDGLADRLASLDSTAPAVVHLAAADRDSHAGQNRLHDLPPKLKNLLERHLPGLREYARSHQRRLIVTTDHGISFARKGLSHGGGGVFEQAVFRWEVAPLAAVLQSPASRSRKI